MSSEGTNTVEFQLYGTNFSSRAHELLMDEGSITGRSTFHNFLGGTSNSNFGLDEVITNAMHPTASFATNRPRSAFEIDHAEGSLINVGSTPHQHQQYEIPSATTAVPFLPQFPGELGRVFQGPSLEQPRLFNVSQNVPRPDQFRNMEMGPNYGGSFPVAPPAAAQGTVTGLGHGNYYLPPTSYLTAQAQQLREYISRVQQPFMQYPYSQNPLGAEINAPAPCFPMTQWANNPNLQQPYSQFIGQGATPEMILQSGGLNSFYPAGMSSNYHPHPPRTIRNSIYDPIYEEMGVPMDPHMRMFQGNNNH